LALSVLQKIFNFLGYSKKDISDVLFTRLPLRVVQTFGGKKDLAALIKKNKLYIHKSRLILPYNDQEFDCWVLPLIEYMAKYYLCLPASYDHHHRDNGGAFEHALQTAISAVTLLNSHKEIYREIDSEFRHEHKDSMPLAVYVLALIHDTGKPISDFFVRACDREVNINYDIPVWKATDETLFDWVNMYSVKYYKAFYDTKRIHKKHESYSGIALSEIAGILKLYKNPALLKKQINEVLYKEDTETNNLLNQIIKAADRSSTRYYMELYGRIPRDNCNSSMFFEGLQSFYFGPDNSHEGYFSRPYFWTNSGLHIHYPNGLNAIYEAIIGLGKRLSSVDEDPADSLISILHNTNHLILVGESSTKHCAIHTIYVENIEVNADGEESKKWSSASVITIKQPHLLKLLEGERIYQSSYENPSVSEATISESIPLEARGLNEDPLGYYESLTSPSAEENVTEHVANTTTESSPSLQQVTEDVTHSAINQAEEINAIISASYSHELDEAYSENHFDEQQHVVNNIQASEIDVMVDNSSDVTPVIIGERDHMTTTCEEEQIRQIKQGAIDTIANITVRSKNKIAEQSRDQKIAQPKRVADPNEIKKAAIDMLGLTKSNDVEITPELSSNLQQPAHSTNDTQHKDVRSKASSNKKPINNGGKKVNSSYETSAEKVEALDENLTKASERNQRKKHNKKISELIRQNEFDSSEECDFIINIFLRISYLFSKKMIDVNNSDILRVEKNNLILAKKFLKSSHFNLPVQSFIVEAYLYKGRYPVKEVLSKGYSIDDQLSTLILGNQCG
jgi:hypothetical protein|tara:strand:- start:16579 stop:18966 length:2388 start_codon:yes stop_codon:yes gene_type:complete